MQVGSLPDKKTVRTSDAGKGKYSVHQDVKNAVMTGLGYFATGAALDTLSYFLEVEHSVDFNSIVDNPRALLMGLSAMFGSSVQVIETKICQALGKQFLIGTEGRSLEDMISIIRSTEFVNNGT